jgi:hypothetical protein
MSTVLWKFQIVKHLLYEFLYFLENKFSSIGPIYYEYGSMVITFDSSSIAVVAYEILKNRIFEDKKLLGEPTNFDFYERNFFILE